MHLKVYQALPHDEIRWQDQNDPYKRTMTAAQWAEYGRKFDPNVSEREYQKRFITFGN